MIPGFGAISEQSIAGQEVVPTWSVLGIPIVLNLPPIVKKVTDQFRWIAESVRQVYEAVREL